VRSNNIVVLRWYYRAGGSHDRPCLWEIVDTSCGLDPCLYGSPRIPEALGRGSFVWVSARVGNDVSGYVCDSDSSGLLLDIRDPSGDPGGYEFLPWSSIERVRV
jgi:hypothetical protein